jgi:hypothetical protein
MKTKPTTHGLKTKWAFKNFPTLVLTNAIHVVILIFKVTRVVLIFFNFQNNKLLVIVNSKTSKIW